MQAAVINGESIVRAAAQQLGHAAGLSQATGAASTGQ